MTILIANIGTSDLAVKVDDYYLPIQFDRSEPNIDDSHLDENSQEYWDNREFWIAESVCKKLNIPYQEKQKGEKKSYVYSFRDLTKALLAHYDDWKNNIIPCRILGIINKAIKEFNVKNIYLFVTDQAKPHEKDTIYLFKILEKWLNDSNYNVTLHPKYIPSEIILNNESLDKLLDYYYSFFQELIYTYSSEEQLLISIKGGIQNMQTALKMQCISSPMQKQLFINPQLSISNLLKGSNSDCNLTSYWQYNKTQKYNTIKQLLNRWDFDGCIEIIKDWNQTLTFLIEQDVIKKSLIKEDRKNIQSVRNILNIGVSIFNLDINSSRSILDNNPDIFTGNLVNLERYISKEGYSNLLNIYSQCCLYSGLGQTANMLSSMMSFYDVMLQTMIEKTGGQQYLNQQYKIDLHKFHKDIGNSLFENFKTVEDGVDGKYYSIKFNRFSKRNYVDILVNHRHQNRRINTEFKSWNQIEYQLEDNKKVQGIFGLLKSLEYWAEIRNDIIHKGKGISPIRLEQINSERPYDACSYNEIIPIMKKILISPLIALSNEYKQNFVEKDRYYIYSDIKEWVINKLIYQFN